MPTPQRDVDQPTVEQCQQRLEVPNRFPTEFAFASWHPQWGGSVGRCVVTFSRETNDGSGGVGCFDVYNWHDGEFPSDETVTSYHYCSAEQLIDFGLAVLEKQRQHQKQNGLPARLPIEQLRTLQARLQALLEEPCGTAAAVEYLQQEAAAEKKTP